MASNTKQRILQAAIDIWQKDPSASLERIAEQAQLTRMTVHRYFKSKDLLYLAVHQEMTLAWQSLIQSARESRSDCAQQLELIVKQAVNLGVQYHFLFHMPEAFQSGFEAVHERCGCVDINQALKEIFQELRTQGVIQAELPIPWLLHLFDGMQMAGVSALQSGTVAPKDVPELVWAGFSQAIFQSDV